MKINKMHTMRRTLILAAVLVLLAAFGTTALAFNIFGLKDLLFPDKQPVSKLDENGEIEYVDMISLSGYAESAAAQAHAEWKAYLNGLDLAEATRAYDEAVRQTGQVDPALARYIGYDVYDRAMADKLEEILAKYGLNLRGEQHDISLPEEWAARVGGDFAGSCRILWGYMYDDGTCFFEGESDTSICFQFSRTVKTTFNDVSLNITDAADYEQWTYRTASGETMLLCLGSAKSLIFGDFPDCFVSLNVLAGRDALGRNDLEALADALDFSLLHPVLPYA